jgi:hypothetical protein
MANETILTLKWCLSDITENYPELTPMQAKKVLDHLHTGKDWLVQEGWNLIADIVNDLLDENI